MRTSEAEADNHCEACKDLRQTVPIGHVRQFEKAHRVVMGNLRDGTLVEVDNPNRQARRELLTRLFGVEEDAQAQQEDFATLLTAETWPDIVLHYFRCNRCQLLFEFAVNTYHGSGGDWRPVFDEDLV